MSMYLHQFPFLWIVFLQKVVAVDSDVFIVLVIKASHVPWTLSPVSCVSMNRDNIRDLGLTVNDVEIVVGVWNGKEDLMYRTEIKQRIHYERD